MKLVKARYGEPVLFRHHNGLPVSPAENGGFGRNTLTTHLHNGHTPAESDGYAGAFFWPGQFYDYRWPMVLAGHDTINRDATDPRAGAPDDSGGVSRVPGDWRETQSTLWFHDHMIDFTSQNVYKGGAGMLARWIESPGKLIDAGDPLALELVERHGGIPMPATGLDAAEVGEVVEFLRSADRRRAAARPTIADRQEVAAPARGK